MGKLTIRVGRHDDFSFSCNFLQDVQRGLELKVCGALLSSFVILEHGKQRNLENNQTNAHNGFLPSHLLVVTVDVTVLIGNSNTTLSQT